MYYLGIDPGVGGGAALLDARGQVALRDGDSSPIWMKFKDKTPQEIADFLRPLMRLVELGELRAAIENVSSSPQMGVVSAFTFGRSTGFLHGLLAAYRVPYESPRPQKWQKALGCMSKGDKNVTKARAHSYWPGHADRITHGLADALLLAYWLKLYWAQQEPTPPVHSPGVTKFPKPLRRVR